MSQPRTIRAPRGTTLRCKGWVQEAALRMLMNNLDPEVAERPEDLVVYGGTGKAARTWEAFDVIVRELEALGDDETLLVQSGKAGRRASRPTPTRRACSSPTPTSCRTGRPGSKFRELEKAGLIMYGQMTAGSWIYIGTQGILQGTYETFAAAARGTTGPAPICRARFVVTGGPRRHGRRAAARGDDGGGVFLGVEVDPARIAAAPRDALPRRAGARSRRRARAAASAPRKEGRALSVGLEGNAADVLPELVRRGVVPDLVTDQTSAHDPLRGYVPAGRRARRRPPSCARAIRRSTSSARARRWPSRSRAMLDAEEARRARLRLRQQPARPGALTAGVDDALRRSRASCRRTSARSSARARGRSAGWRSRAIRTTSRVTDARSSSCSPTTPHLHRWIAAGRRARRSSRGCRRASAGSATASATAPAWRSTSWCARARSRRRSSSAAITSTAARWRRRTARPRR